MILLGLLASLTVVLCRSVLLFDVIFMKAYVYGPVHEGGRLLALISLLSSGARAVGNVDYGFFHNLDGVLFLPFLSLSLRCRDTEAGLAGFLLAPFARVSYFAHDLGV